MFAPGEKSSKHSSASMFYSLRWIFTDPDRVGQHLLMSLIEKHVANSEDRMFSGNYGEGVERIFVIQFCHVGAAAVR